MIKNIASLLFIVFIFVSCDTEEEYSPIHKLDLSNHTATVNMIKSDKSFTTYLPIYTSVFTRSQNQHKPVTTTVSIHNINVKDSLFVNKINYYNTEGEFVRSYIENPIFIRPMETINIVVHQADNSGGTGANFLIDWVLNNQESNPPLIDALMISTTGQHGLSFTTRGISFEN